MLNPEVLVCIDGSYLIYYALFGAVREWKESNSPNLLILENVDQENLPKLTVFNEFTKLLEDKIIERFNTVYWIINKRIFKDLKFTNTPKVYLCLDSSLKDNWRMQYYKEYKQQRKTAIKEFDVGDAFNYSLNIILNKINIEEYFDIKVLKVKGAEGDDIIAVLNKNINAQFKFIIASDKDYLQLSENIKMFDLSGKEVKPEPYKDIEITGKQYLLAKILKGDTSDNIPQVFPRCGYATAVKLVLNPELLKQKLKENPEAFEIFKINSKIIDFKNIPDSLNESIMDELAKIGEYI